MFRLLSRDTSFTHPGSRASRYGVPVARTIIRWVRRLVAVAAVAVLGAVVVRLLSSEDRVGSAGSEAFPAIGGDTWPPVPTNPDRPG